MLRAVQFNVNEFLIQQIFWFKYGTTHLLNFDFHS